MSQSTDESIRNGNKLLTRFYMLENNGQLNGDSTNNILSTIISTGFIKARTTCSESFLAAQVIDVDCDAKKGEEIRKNANCVSCLKLAEKAFNDRKKLENDTKILNRSYRIQTPKDSTLANYQGLKGDYTFGVCKYVCVSCISENVNQNLQVKLTTECNVDDELFVSSFTSTVTEEARKMISAHKTALKTTELNIKTNTDIDKLSLNLTSSIMQIRNTTTITDLNSKALAIQQTKIAPNSSSVLLDNASQTMSLELMKSVTSKLYNDDFVKTKINFKINQEAIRLRADFSDVLESLVEGASQTQSIFSSILGRAMIIGISLLIFVVILLIFLVVYFSRSS